jgi:hypothetical protein
VYAQLGNGHSEGVYHRALALELMTRQVVHFSEYTVPFHYRCESGECFTLGHGRIDVLVRVGARAWAVLELKAIPKSLVGTTDEGARAQLLRYVRALNEERARNSTTPEVACGYVVNFRQHGTSGGPEVMKWDAHTKEWSVLVSGNAGARGSNESHA